MLKDLPPEQVDRLLLGHRSLAEAETDRGRQEFLEAFAHARGLTDEES
ncbi:hypothetical protein [Kitasatospora sp. NPDC050543]